LSYVPTAAIMGNIGVGKTTLFNSLCGTQHIAEESEGSLTQNLYFHSVSLGNFAFNLIDTPGFNSLFSRRKLSIQIRHSLTTKELNTIFVILPFQSRYQLMLQEFFEIERIITKFNEKIVIMISKFDFCQNKEQAITLTFELFKNNGIKNNIIFFSQNSDKFELSELMYSCMSVMKSEKLSIDDEEFFSKFHINEPNYTLDKAFENYKNILNKIYKDFSDQLNVIKSEKLTIQEREDKLHFLNISFRNEIECQRNDCHDRLVKDLRDDQCYTLSIQIHKEFIQYCDKFAKFYKDQMSFNPDDSSDPRNMLRKCPHCDLIWFKTEGCDGVTNCGTKGQKYDNQKEKAYKFVKYIFQYVEGKLTCIKNHVPAPEPVPAPDESEKFHDFLGVLVIILKLLTNY
jgi:small GTP-binding protein